MTSSIPITQPFLTSPIFRAKLLALSNGSFLSFKAFTTHPLFKAVKEQDMVYSKLIEMIDQPDFPINYRDFQRNLSTEYWFESYLEDPNELAALSLYAYLDGKIDQEELFIMQTLAEVIQRQKTGDIISIQMQILDKNNAKTYLQEANFPLFNSSKEFLVDPRNKLKESQKLQELTAKDPSLTSEEFQTLKEALCTHKSDYATKKQEIAVLDTSLTPEEIIQFQNEFCEEIDGIKSFVKRTCIEYRSTLEPSSLDLILYYARIGEGCKDTQTFEIKKTYTTTTVLPPPYLCINLYRKIAPYPCLDPSSYSWMFGFSEDSTPFIEGSRACSVPSIFFDVPYVHNSKKGLKKLSLYMHDIFYHIPVEMTIPPNQKLAMIDVAKRLQEATKTTRKKLWKEALVDCTNYFLDKDVIAYHSINISFRDVFLKYAYGGAIKQKSKFPKIKQYTLWVDKCFMPALLKGVQNHLL